MQVINFSHFSYLAPLLVPVTTLIAWLIRPASTKRLVPLANAPLSHQRLTLPFAHAGESHRKHASGRVSSFRSAAFEVKKPAITRLRVVREHDAAVSPTCAGRMTISGCMADVCAELDGMAQREAA